MVSDAGIRKVSSWQQYTFCRNAFRNDTIYAVIIHASGCKDCEDFIPKIYEAVEEDGDLPVVMEYHVGGLKELRENQQHPVKGELERLSGTRTFPTLAIFKGKNVLKSYTDADLKEFTKEDVYELLRQAKYQHQENTI